MKTYKIYADNHVETTDYHNYKKWLEENTPLYFIGPHLTADDRKIYTAFSANSLNSSCFTTLEIFLDDQGQRMEDNIYESKDWISARELHKKLLQPKTTEAKVVEINKRITSSFPVQKQLGLR